MRICHISDLHGEWFDIPSNCDIVVNSGDWLINTRYWYNKVLEAEYQKQYLLSNINKFKSSLNDRPYFFILGNHDFVAANEVEEILNKNGIKAFNLENKLVTYNQINFYGFPWIPYINGKFNFELREDEMSAKVDELITKINENTIDVLVLHCPIKGELSLEVFNVGQNQYTSTDYGNKILADKLDAVVERLPDLCLVGHLHYANGIKYSNRYKMLIVNSATTLNIIDF
ncbi:MAG: metallophosphoesterase [Chitinophagales bacterium]|nr:metallophosphoesterase [Chitinophagales bacterium]